MDSRRRSFGAMSTPQNAPFVLTERQLQVIELIARGCSNEEVGMRLGISPRTAKAHCDVLRQKLGVEVAVELVGPGETAPLTGLEVRQKPIRLIDGRR